MAATMRRFDEGKKRGTIEMRTSRRMSDGRGGLSRLSVQASVAVEPPRSEEDLRRPSISSTSTA